MRKAIRKQLIDALPEVNGRVFEPFMASKSTKKPYVVVKNEGDTPSNIRQGFDVPYEVWVYVEPETFNVLDSLCDKVVRTLNRVDMTTESGHGFTLRYGGSSPDFYDEDWKALTRRLDFNTYRIHGG